MYNTYAHIPLLLITHIHTYTYTLCIIYTYIHTHTYIHIHIYIIIHTYRLTYMSGCINYIRWICYSIGRYTYDCMQVTYM